MWEDGAATSLSGTAKRLASLRPKAKSCRGHFSVSPRRIVNGMTPYEYWLKFWVGPNIPLGREQTVEDMGRAVVFFASDDGNNITGQTLHVDGGQVMR